jgi:hypothetical protein
LNSSVRECGETINLQQQDIEIGELKAPGSRVAMKENVATSGDATDEWRRVSLLLENERPFARFEEFDGRQRHWK